MWLRVVRTDIGNRLIRLRGMTQQITVGIFPGSVNLTGQIVDFICTPLYNETQNRGSSFRKPTFFTNSWSRGSLEATVLELTKGMPIGLPSSNQVTYVMEVCVCVEQSD
jgi:hypothetical protein